MHELVSSPLADLHTERGVVLAEYHGAKVPQRFSDPYDEYAAVRSQAGLFDFSFRRRFAARGPDHISLLHNILSNDVMGLRPGQGCYATLLNVKGQILADMQLYRTEEAVVVETDADLYDKVIHALERYIIMDDVKLQGCEHSTLSFQGPQSRSWLADGPRLALPHLEELGYARIDWEGGALDVARVNSTGEEGYEVSGPAEALRRLWKVALSPAHDFHARPCGIEALEMLRIEAGIPRYGSELGEDTLPLEANLFNALSFTKGCYVGQEIVERSRSRGQVHWRLVGLKGGERALIAGGKIVADGRDVGEVTSAAFSPRLKANIALSYVRREYAEAGTRLGLSNGEIAEVCGLPFATGS